MFFVSLLGSSVLLPTRQSKSIGMSSTQKTRQSGFSIAGIPAKTLLLSNYFDIRSSNEPAERSCLQL